jgi:hypothetical protein
MIDGAADVVPSTRRRQKYIHLQSATRMATDSDRSVIVVVFGLTQQRPTTTFKHGRDIRTSDIGRVAQYLGARYVPSVADILGSYQPSTLLFSTSSRKDDLISWHADDGLWNAVLASAGFGCEGHQVQVRQKKREFDSIG